MTTQERSSSARAVVVGVDGTAGSRAALRFAAEEAQLRKVDLAAVFAETLDAEETPSGRPATADESDTALLAALMAGPAAAVAVAVAPPLRVAGGTRRLEHVVTEELGAAPPVPVRLEVWEGRAPRVLSERSASAPLVVVGARSHGGVPRLSLGSVAQHLLRHAGCPVVVVPPPAPATPDATTAPPPVVVGVAVTNLRTPETVELLRFAAAEARLRSSRLVVAVVGDGEDRVDQSAPAADHDAVARIGELVAEDTGDKALEVQVVLRLGTAAPALADEGREAALLVVGSRHASVVDHAVCPVAVVTAEPAA